MTFRKPCEHGVYDKHHLTWSEREALAETGRIVLVSEELVCPGGQSPDDDAAIEAIARSRWEARFGEGTWGTTTREYTRQAFRQSAKRDWQAALDALQGDE